MHETPDTRHRHNHELAAPLDQATSGRLIIGPKAAQLAIGADPTLTDLYRATFETPPPTVHVQDGTVTLHYPRLAWLTEPGALLRPAPSGQITLNGSIPWHIRVGGGTAHTRFDLHRLALQALELGGGASRVDLILPTPAGTVPVRVAGGVHDLTIQRPAGVAVQVRVGRGASRLILDDQHFGAIGNSTRWQSPDYDQRSDRYDIAISGGADTLTVTSG